MTSTPSTQTVFIGVPAEQDARIREMVAKLMTVKPPMFASVVRTRLVPTEVEVFQRAKDGKMHVRMVFETTVEADMMNDQQVMQGGCAVYLIDFCSSVAAVVLAMALDKPPTSLTQSLNASFHAPASVGAKLEIVNTTLAFGGRTVSIVTEIWDVTNKRLCVAGVHHKMLPSKPAAKL